MLSKELKQNYVLHDTRGVGFDQHYTDSALRLLAPKAYLAHEKRVKTRRSIPKQEILVSLLLFGKAYLSRPTWFYDTEFPELEIFQTEDLIDWIPDNTYISAFDSLSWLLPRLQSLWWELMPKPLSLSMDKRKIMRDYYRLELEREIVVSELTHDIDFIFEKLFYVSPLLNSNTRHLGSRSLDPTGSLVNGAGYLPLWPPFSLEENGTSKLESLKIFEGEYGSFWEWGKGLIESHGPEEAALAREAALILDGAMSSIAAERFASLTSLPLKTNSLTTPLRTPVTVFGDEAYQLLRVQFHNLRYPVIETIEDVLRLRDDPHLKTYRAVIGEYSERLRQELEDGRSKVLESFSNDVKAALRSLAVIKRWSRVVDWSFYISLPLVVIGSLYGLPLSDIVTIPLTSYAKFVTYQKRKELDWILFDRHQ